VLEKQKYYGSLVTFVNYKASAEQYINSVFRQFGQGKFAYGGSILSPSQFIALPQVPQKM
jgi:hypothetical protein